jgi:hypothetical protein
MATYAVGYSGNGNDGGTAPVDTGSPYSDGATVAVRAPGTLSLTGYSFSSWNTAAGGGGTTYAPGETFTMPAAAVTLYAQWTLEGAYCDTDDVKSELQYLTLTTTSKPSVSDVNDFCDEIKEELDAVFEAVGIALPITETRPLSIAKQIAVLGVCARILRSIQESDERAKWYQQLYDDRITMIRKLPSVMGVTGVESSSGIDGFIPTTSRRPWRRGKNDW